MNAFQYNNDTAEPETLSPRIVWDMVKCESMVRDNFIMIASKQEKKARELSLSQFLEIVLGRSRVL